MHDAPAPDEWYDRLGNVAPEKLPARIEMSITGKHLGIVAQLTLKCEPACEVVGVIRIDAHTRSRDIDAMRGLRGIIGKAASQPHARLEDGNLPTAHGAIARKVHRNHGSGEATADDRDGRAGGVLAEGIHHIEDLLRSGDRVVVDL